ncbi:MAG: hypothetical protein M1830_008317 [Pleopsidium flavum]|nr:MAG: hypothetical protein M1830_008317 [Pleopsidium flavum]
MSTAQQQNAAVAAERLDGGNKEYDTNGNHLTNNMSHEEHAAARAAARFGYGPLAHVNTSSGGERLPAFGGEFQPGTYRPVKDRKFANPAPLGLSAFALTTFVLSLINMGTRGVAEPNIVVALAFGYGGLVQLLAGMWEMAVGNTFGATALSSYGGFWIAFGIVLTPGGFAIVSTVEKEGGTSAFYDSFGFFLMGWFIFTTLLLICTLRSTVAFFTLFFTLDLAFLLLGIGYLHRKAGKPNPPIIKAGGFFGLLAAFLAWYNALAGIADDSNSFFIIPVAHFPWSVAGMEKRQKSDRTNV